MLLPQAASFEQVSQMNLQLHGARVAAQPDSHPSCTSGQGWSCLEKATLTLALLLMTRQAMPTLTLSFCTMRLCVRTGDAGCGLTVLLGLSLVPSPTQTGSTLSMAAAPCPSLPQPAPPSELLSSLDVP